MPQAEDVIDTTRPGASTVEDGGQMSRPLPTLLGLARGLTAPPSKPSDVERPGSPAAAAPHRPFGGRKGKRAAADRCNR